MARPGLVWVNTSALERTLGYARQAGAPEGELVGTERALAARDRPKYRWTMLVKRGFRDVHRLIRGGHVRDRLYCAVVFDELIAGADDNGLYMFEPDELAAEIQVPRVALYRVLQDLEAEPVAAVTRLKKGPYIRGVQLTEKVREQPAPNPRRGNGGARKAA